MGALAYSKSDVIKMKNRLEGLQSRAKNTIQKAHKHVETGVRTLEVSGGAFAAGLIEGKYGSVEIMGAPLDLALGIGGHVAAFVMDTDMSSHLHSVSDGFIAGHCVKKGFAAGQAWKAKETESKE